MDTLQLMQVALCAGVVVPVRLVMTRIRRPVVRRLERAGQYPIRVAVVTADVTATLVYVAFVLAAFPLEYESRLAAHYFERAFDEVAVFALVVAIVEVVSVQTIRRTALDLEWQDIPDGAAARP